MPVTFEDIKTAHKRIKSFIHNTPVLTSRYFDQLCGAEIFFKCENFQKVGAFKIRGAANAVFSLKDEELRNGVITHSSGNHGAALAQAAMWRNAKCYVITPRQAPKIKIKALQTYGAELTFSEATLASRQEECDKVIAKTGAVFIHPYDNDAVISGQGTAALELIDEVRLLDYLFVPVGGGGLTSGSAITLKHMLPKAKAIACEPELADDACQSFKTGRLHPPKPPVTIADGLRTALSDRTFSYIRQYVDDVVTVSDEEIISAMRKVWERMKIIIEPSSATPLAVVLKMKKELAGKRVGIIFSGGNIDLEKLPW